MASVKVLDAFMGKLGELADLGRDVKELTRLVAQHEAKALRELLARVKPLMEHIDGPITTREDWVASDNPQDRQSFYYKEPGLVLVNNFESTVRDAHGRMNYSGYKIVFTRSGKVVQLDRVGSWSEEDKADTFWSSDAHEITLDPAFAERHLEECVSSIVAAITRSITKNHERRATLRRRLKILRAVQRMLQGIEHDDDHEHDHEEAADAPDA